MSRGMDSPPRSMETFEMRLGTRLAIAFLLALWLAMLVAGGPGVTIDVALLEAAQRRELVPAARLATWLGDWAIVAPAALAGAAWLAWRSQIRRAAMLVLIVGGGRLLIELQKYQFDRARPDPEGHLVAVHNMAFPSGHAANAMMGWLAIALLAAPPRLRGPAGLMALLAAAAAGLSRPVLGVHWPSDVAGGWAFGAAWVLLLAGFAERGRPSFIDPSKESDMIDKDRPDDSALIDEMEGAPSHGGSSGGNLQRDVATQAEEEHEIGGAAGVTRVTGEDKAADGDLPTLPQRD